MDWIPSICSFLINCILSIRKVGFVSRPPRWAPQNYGTIIGQWQWSVRKGIVVVSWLVAWVTLHVLESGFLLVKSKNKKKKKEYGFGIRCKWVGLVFDSWWIWDPDMKLGPESESSASYAWSRSDLIMSWKSIIFKYRSEFELLEHLL